MRPERKGQLILTLVFFLGFCAFGAVDKLLSTIGINGVLAWTISLAVTFLYLLVAFQYVFRHYQIRSTHAKTH
ncbi:hypothetical protein FD09_GL000686 [Schleiferilactobacillus perolens DSM 12744]|uniref:Uncharacterized protein n=1 Tax=Schleiferilactobacillus perolens DSM 12744 TaxID=1423792 RepID=A0A0R1MTF9_9LACO|nr:hypothetical protein FD09_GL000686 [Schleiferilactobacillus perolens DSM 12744]